MRRATTTFSSTETGCQLARSVLDAHRAIDACTPLPCLATLGEADVDAELRRLEHHRSEAIEIGLRQASPCANRIAGDGGAVPTRVVVGPNFDRATCTRLVELEDAAIAISLLGTPALHTPAKLRPAIVELLVYLALHRNQAPFSRDELTRRLWPGSAQSPKTIQNRLSEALAIRIGDRAAMERGPDDRLARRGDVVSDWERFQALPATGDLGTYAEALRLIRGVPLAGREDDG